MWEQLKGKEKPGSGREKPSLFDRFSALYFGAWSAQTPLASQGGGMPKSL